MLKQEANQTPKNQPGFFYGYVIVIACFVMMVVWWGSFHSFGVFLKPLVTDFGWDRATTAIAYSLQGFLMGLFSIPIAKLCYKFGPQLVIGTCGFLGGLGLILMSQVNAVWQVYFLYGVPMALNMGAYISILPVVAKWFIRRRGMMTGVVFSGMGIGMVLLPPLVSQLITLYDWRFTYIVVGIIAMAGVVIGAQFLKFDPYQVGLLPYGQHNLETADSASELSSFNFLQALRTRNFWLIATLYFTYLICQTAVTVHIVVHAIDMGVSAINAAQLLVIFGVLLIAGFNVIGITGDRVGNKAGFALSLALMITAFILVILTEEIWLLYVFMGILGFACGGMQVLFSPIVAELFGMKSHGVILASVGFIGGIGAAIGAPMAGYVFDVTSSYKAAFIICGAISAVGLITSMALRSTKKLGDRI